MSTRAFLTCRTTSQPLEVLPTRLRMAWRNPGEVVIPRNNLTVADRMASNLQLFRHRGAFMLESDRPHVLPEMIYVCRPAGILSVPGVYGGLIDKLPFGVSMNKGLTWKMGQTHVYRCTENLLKRIQEGQIDPSFVITHTVALEDKPGMYKTFRDKDDGCIEVVLKP